MNRKSILNGLVALLLLVAALKVYLDSSEENRRAIRSDAGYLTSGEVLGVAVGGSRQSAGVGSRRHGFVEYVRAKKDTCLHHRYGPEFSIDVYADESWRSGTMCVVYDQKQTISHIEWSYGPFMIDL